MRLDQIQNPAFLKDLSISELRDLSHDIRKTIIETVSKKGGHLSSNLGIVDVTIALHRIFNAPKDKLIFDVGHQSYTHKILTGRYEGFVNSLREFSGISGYQKRNESEYDCYEAGHSSTSISAACGFAVAQRLKGETDQIVAIIGDASITSGMALEALNNLGMMKEKVIVILNDNNMAISKPVGAISRLFSRLRISSPYTSTKSVFRKMLLATGVGRWLITYLRKLKNAIRRFIVGTTLFEKLNLEYIGPIDGHNYREMLRIFNVAKERPNSVVVHVITKKGQGYPWAENDADGKWHGVNGFNVETGIMDGHSSKDEVSWSEATATIVESQMGKDPLLTVITPAMIEGSKLSSIFNRFPDRSYDVGIAEQHAVTFASGISAEGAHPYVCIYSTFLQRSYDQLLHDFGRMKLPAVFGLDRAGLVGKDGATHQGIYDVGMLKTIPGSIIAMPRDYHDAQLIYEIAFQYQSLFFIRFPRENVSISNNPIQHRESITIGSWEYHPSSELSTETIIVTGPNYWNVLNYITTHNFKYNLVFARYYQPIDDSLIKQLFLTEKRLYIYDIYADEKGIAESIFALAKKENYKGAINAFTLPSDYIEQGDISSLYRFLHLDLDTVIGEIKSLSSGI